MNDLNKLITMIKKSKKKKDDSTWLWLRRWRRRPARHWRSWSRRSGWRTVRRKCSPLAGPPIALRLVHCNSEMMIIFKKKKKKYSGAKNYSLSLETAMLDDDLSTI